MASLETLLGRVKKLLALATSSNVHEAAAAAAAAQALINRHQLTSLLAGHSADPNDPITSGLEAPLESAKRFRRWKLFLATGLAVQNAGLAWSTDLGAETQLCFCGHRSDRLAMMAVWSSLVTRIEWLSASHGAGRDRHWHEAFRIGAAEEIVARMAAGDVVDGDYHDESDGPPLTALTLSQVRPLRAARVAAVTAFAAALPRDRGRAVLVDLRAVKKGKAAAASLLR